MIERRKQPMESALSELGKPSFITISDRPQLKGNQGRLTGSDLRYFYEWIVRNKDVLLAYWNGTMQIERVLRSLQY